MTKRRFEWFPFYPAGWLDKNVLRMTLEAQGAYIRILCHMWKDSPDQCSIEDDDALLAELLGISRRKWGAIRDQIQNKKNPIFSQKNGKLISKRLKKERKTQTDCRKRQQEAGLRGAKKRWGGHSPAIGTPSQENGERMANRNRSSNGLRSRKKVIGNNQDARAREGHGPSRASGSNDGDGSRPSALADKNSETRPSSATAAEARRKKIAAAIKGCELLVDEDCTEAVRRLAYIGVEPKRAWAACVQSRGKDRPPGYLVKILADPDFAISDEAWETAGREMRRYKFLEGM